MSVKIASRQRDTVTISLTLPSGGLFEDQIAALRKERDEQAKMYNIESAQALHTLVVLAEAGMRLFMTATSAPIIESGS